MAVGGPDSRWDRDSQILGMSEWLLQKQCVQAKKKKSEGYPFGYKAKAHTISSQSPGIKYTLHLIKQKCLKISIKK